MQRYEDASGGIREAGDVGRTREVGSVELKKPLISIVRPLEAHYWRTIGDFIDVKKPVQVHVFGDGEPDFRERFPGELLRWVRELRADGESKIHIHYDLDSPQRGFIEEAAAGMGFYRRGKLLCIDVGRFDRFARESK